jgi:signal transduction histidine kinase
MLSGAILLLREAVRSRIPGIALVMAGAVVVLQHLGSHSGTVLAPGALAGALLLVLGPWVWRLTSERSERIRLAERAEIAARVHDSVLQTLALVQRDADDPARVRALARRQERELRRWLYGSGFGDATTLADALADAAADVEEAHGVRIELAASGDAPYDNALSPVVLAARASPDAPYDDALSPVVLAAREAMTNAAKHSGAEEISVYAEVDADRVAVFVRDRGAGFDRSGVAADRRGLAESIEARMQRAGGAATITSSPGEGTEVELTMPRRAET